ncbi:MAG: biotin transporter BioY [Elusimicrobiota bacterium]
MRQSSASASEVFLGDALFPSRPVPAFVMVMAMSFIIAICAQISIPLPWTPVPLSGGTLGVLYAGALLGSRRGALAVALYLTEGACGLPFFAGGAAGFIHFAGPTGGYLIGFLPAAYATGKLAEAGWAKSPFQSFAMMLLGSLIILASGLLGLARFLPYSRLLAAGFYPFIPGDIAKACISAALLPGGWKLVGKSAAADFRR